MAQHSDKRTKGPKGDGDETSDSFAVGLFLGAFGKQSEANGGGRTEPRTRNGAGVPLEGDILKLKLLIDLKAAGGGVGSGGSCRWLLRMQLVRIGTSAGMIIDGVGIHDGDWPLISISEERDIKNYNWRANGDVDGVHVCVCVCVAALGCFSIIAGTGESC